MQVSSGISDLAQDMPVPAKALEKYMESCYPIICWKLRIMEIEGGVCVFTTMCPHPGGKIKDICMEKYFLTAVGKAANSLLHLFPSSAGEEHLHMNLVTGLHGTKVLPLQETLQLGFTCLYLVSLESISFHPPLLNAALKYNRKTLLKNSQDFSQCCQAWKKNPLDFFFLCVCPLLLSMEQARQ